jgi:predicted transposase YdaD
MSTIDEMLNKAKRFERGYIQRLSRTLRENKRLILRLQKDQLLSGVDVNANKLTPSYQDDPFFKSQHGLDKYVAFKQKRERKHESMRIYKLFSEKSGMTPNLIFASSEAKSQFHRHLRVDVTGDVIRIYGTWSKSKNVETKYPTALGLTQRSFNVMWNSILNKDIIDYWYEL